MARINLPLQHRWTLEEAGAYLETAVPEAHSQLRVLVRQVIRSADHRRVRLDGVGFWGEIRADAQGILASGAIVVLGKILGSHIATGSGTSSSRLFSANGPEAAALREVVRGWREVARMGGSNAGGFQPHGMYAVEDCLSARRRQSSDTGRDHHSAWPTACGQSAHQWRDGVAVSELPGRPALPRIHPTV
jgi:hypothetical protein